MKKPDAPAPEFEKEVVRLPDGRELTFYRFPESPEKTAERDQAGDSRKER